MVEIASKVNWGSSVTVAWSFKTDVFTSSEGYETRSAQREFPRVKTDFSLQGGKVNDPGWKGLYASNLANLIEFPDLVRRTVSESRGSGFFEGDFNHIAFATGAGVFVESHDEFHHSTVFKNESGLLQVADSLPISIGDRVNIYPSMRGRIAADPTYQHLTSSLFSAGMSLECYVDKPSIADVLDWVPEQWYRDKPVLLWSPNWKDTVQESWSRPSFSFDTGYGSPFIESSYKSPTRTGSYRTLAKTKEIARELVSAFCYCRGRQGSFYAPTWVDDFVFASPVVEGQSVIRVQGQSALHLFEDTDTYRNIAIRFNGQMHLTGITEIYASGSDSEIVLSQPIPEGFNGATRGSWLLKQRFSTDVLELEFRTDRIAEVSVRTVSLIEDHAGLEIDGFALTMGGLYVTVGSERDIDTSSSVTFNGYDITIGGDFLS